MCPNNSAVAPDGRSGYRDPALEPADRESTVLNSLRNARLRRLLMLGAGVLAALLVLIQLTLVKDGSLIERLRSALDDNLSEIIALVVTSGLAVGFFHFFIKEEEELGEIRPMDPQTSRSTHDLAATGSTFWFAEGHIGRWVREHVFPEFVRNAERELQIHTITLSILDPAAEDICTIHVARRRTQHARQEQRWDVRRFQAEICATVLAAVAIRARYDRLRFTVFLKDDSAPTRLDICSRGAFLTIDDALAPAVFMEPNTKIYKTILAHFQEYDRNQPTARKLDIDKGARQARLSQAGSLVLPPASYAKVARAAGLHNPLLDDPDFCELISTCSKVLRGHS
jgi:hypothetical protein